MNDLAQVSLQAPKLCLCGCELSARGSEPELTTKDFATAAAAATRASH